MNRSYSRVALTVFFTATFALAQRGGPIPQQLTFAPAEPAAVNPASPGPGNPNGFAGGNTGRNNGLYAVGAAVEPTKIGLAAPRPADFDAVWAGKLAAQEKVPINPVLTPVQTDTPGIEMSTFVLDALDLMRKDTPAPLQRVRLRAGWWSMSTHTISFRPIPVETRRGITLQSAIRTAKPPTS